MGRKLRVVGCDPSLRNWGLSKGTYDLETKTLTLEQVSVVQPVIPESKSVRQNSKDLESAKQLCAETSKFIQDAEVMFVEVPVGSQSARAMASYGIVVGVLGALRASSKPFFEVTPNEVKMSTVGNKTATKTEMIQWAISRHPEVAWPMYKRGSETLVSEAKAEHMADATCAIYAGINSNEFKQLIQFI